MHFITLPYCIALHDIVLHYIACFVLYCVALLVLYSLHCLLVCILYCNILLYYIIFYYMVD